jgi:Glycosyltransferases, probably involved in cell wall biogenesis
MSLETIHILLNIIMIFAALYLICIGAFTLGLFKIDTQHVISTEAKRNGEISSNQFRQDSNGGDLFIKGECFRKAQVSTSLEMTNRNVSVIIAAKNECQNIQTLLQSLYNQSYSKEKFEVVLVDDHSDDDTYEISERFRALYPEMRLKLLKATGSGKKQAISQALHAAENELVMVTDADCELPPRWIEVMVGYFMNHDLKMLLGPVLLSPTNTLFEKLQVLEHLSLIASTAGSATIGMPVMCNGANMMYNRQAALDVEKYRTDMRIASGDDMFLMEQFIKHYGSQSVKFLLDNEAIVKTATMPNLKSFFRQRTRWASKTKAYTNWKIIATALIVLLFNLSIVFFFVAGFFMHVFWCLFVLYIILKTLIDFPILKGITRFMKQQKLMRWIFPLEFVYPFYVVFTAFSGIVTKVRWK